MIAITGDKVCLYVGDTIGVLLESIERKRATAATTLEIGLNDYAKNSHVVYDVMIPAFVLACIATFNSYSKYFATHLVRRCQSLSYTF